MKPIPFTQFLLPDGRRRDMTIERPNEVANSAEDLLNDGCRLEIEILTTGEVSMTVEKEDDEGETYTLAHEICNNGPDVPISVDKLITDAIKEHTR